jgi:hypothetical protein
MKKLLLIVLLINAICQLKAQNDVNIKLTIEEFNQEESIYLEIGSSRYRLNITENGASSIDASVEQLPTFIKIITISERGKIEPQLPQIWIDSDSISLKINWPEKSFEMLSMLAIQKHSETISSLKGKKQIDYLLSNPDNMPSLYFMDRNLSFNDKADSQITVADLEKFLSNISPKNKKSSYYKRIENYVAARKLRPVKVGKQLAAFSLPDKNGEAYELLSESNKPKIIALLLSGCRFSIGSIQLLEQVHRLSDGQIELITVWSNEGPESWLNTNKAEKEKITWVNLYDEFNFAGSYLKTITYPTFYVVDADGVLVDIWRGYSEKTAKKMKKLKEETLQ